GRYQREQSQLRSLAHRQAGPSLPRFRQEAGDAPVARRAADRGRAAALAPRLRDGRLRHRRPRRAGDRRADGEARARRQLDRGRGRRARLSHPRSLHRRGGHRPARAGPRAGRV
ncbi:MAG: FIG00802509: hypothetical protein, partial [uncultured Sphingomonadaceae bacterium]